MGLRVLCSNYNHIHVHITAILELLSVTQNTIIIKIFSIENTSISLLKRSPWKLLIKDYQYFQINFTNYSLISE